MKHLLIIIATILFSAGAIAAEPAPVISHAAKTRCGVEAKLAASLANRAYDDWVNNPSKETANQILGRQREQQRQVPSDDPTISDDEVFALAQAGVDYIGTYFTTVPAQPDLWKKGGDMRGEMSLFLEGWCKHSVSAAASAAQPRPTGQQPTEEDNFLLAIDAISPNSGKTMREVAALFAIKCGQPATVKDMRYLAQNTVAYAWLLAAYTAKPDKQEWPSSGFKNYRRLALDFNCPGELEKADKEFENGDKVADWPAT